MNTLIKLLTDDDKAAIEEPKWCLADPVSRDAPRILCCGSVFGDAESAATYEIKEVERGGIECNACMRMIKAYKRVRL